MLDLTKDERWLESPTEPHARSLPLENLLARQILASPDSKKPLHSIADQLTDGETSYPLSSGSPVLYPSRILDQMVDFELPLKYYSDALLQYCVLSQIKQQGEINAPANALPAQKHRHRFREFAAALSGLTLDIGCDSPSGSAALLPENCAYVGLDPYAKNAEFRVVGLGESLPFTDGSFDNVLFNTSLDHMLDFRTAIDEACRALKPEGNLVIATYAWIDRATLLTDSVHFHHFRETEITDALSARFSIERLIRYEDPKGQSHRYGLYIAAKKRF